MIRRLLIANRGEIAVRIARACRELGVESVAAYSEADARALHVMTADRAVSIGPAPPADSYLSIPRLLEAARACGADAVHPGYGFLSENAAFAEACERTGLVFVGPPSHVIARMGSKIDARRLMDRSGVPVVPGESPLDQSDEALGAAVERLGLPAIIKPSAGGGGKGMHRVLARDEIAGAVQAARREAMAAFGDGTLYVERLIEGPHHVEVQIVGDRHGHLVHAFERECSLQRRHQKVIEESPSPAITPALRERLTAAAVTAARAVSYSSTGTVEFLVDLAAPDIDRAPFYFLEMNTRLQVEHPVTEQVAGIDLVRAQLIVASGGPLPWGQDALAQRGHAVEARVYAEDPRRGFLPRAGRLALYREPRLPGVRVDAGFVEGDEISSHYDPLLAKVIAVAETRDLAVARLIAALRGYPILGIETNIPYLLRILEHPRFRSGHVDTSFLEGDGHSLAEEPGTVVPAPVMAAMAIHGEAAADSGARPGRPHSEWDPWRRLTSVARVNSSGPTAARIGPGIYRVECEERSEIVYVAGLPGDRWAFWNGRVFRDGMSRQAPHAAQPTRAAVALSLTAPMPATVLKVLVASGSQVKTGDTVIILEAMKMELPVRTSHTGTVTAVHCRQGELVQSDTVLVEIASGNAGSE